MALSADRNTPERNGKRFTRAVKANEVIYRGALVAYDANGDIVKGAVATTLIAAGVAYTSTAEDAAQITFERGVFRFKNSSAGDLIAKTEIGKNVYIVDDETVAKTNGSSTRSIAGVCRDVDSVGVWVEI